MQYRKDNVLGVALRAVGAPQSQSPVFPLARFELV